MKRHAGAQFLESIQGETRQVWVSAYIHIYTYTRIYNIPNI